MRPGVLTPLAIAALSAGCPPALVGFPGDAPFSRPSFAPNGEPGSIPGGGTGFGSAGIPDVDLPPVESTDCTLCGDLPAIDGLDAIEPGGHLGWSTAVVSDGVLVVGAPGSDAGEVDGGAAWILSHDGELALTALVIGSEADAAAGTAVAAGDLDGDGSPDLVIGAPGQHDGSGAVFVLPLQQGIATKVTAGIELRLEETVGFGAALAVADLDGDGVDDLVASAPSSGVVAIWYGPLTNSADPAVLLESGSGAAVFGTALAAIEDQDGDGLGELLVGAPGATGVVARSGVVHLLDGAGDIVSSWSGAAPGDLAGAAVAIGGDTDGDGVVELLVGAPGVSSAAATDRGAAYLLPMHAPPASLIGAAAVALEGPMDGDRAGRSVAFAGDVNGDGLDDVLIGGPTGIRAVAPSGLGWLVEGGTGPLSLRNARARFLSTEQGQSLAHAVAGAGDLDGDGFDDVLITAPGASFKASAPGAIFPFYGGP